MDLRFHDDRTNDDGYELYTIGIGLRTVGVGLDWIDAS